LRPTDKGQLSWGWVGLPLFTDYEFGFDLETH